MNSLDWARADEIINALVGNDGRVAELPYQLEMFWRSLLLQESDEAIVRFGLLISELNDGRGERWGLFDLLDEINGKVAEVAYQLGNFEVAGRFWHDRGQAFHRKGLTTSAMDSFRLSAGSFELTDLQFQHAESVYMTAICYRALGDTQAAKITLKQVLEFVGLTPWRANPLIVLGWIERDGRNTGEAKRLLEEAIALLKTEASNANRLILAQTLTDLAEVETLLGDFDSAEENFRESIARFRDIYPIDSRQLARSFLKLARLMRRKHDLHSHAAYLRDAVAILEVTQHYQLIAQVQIELAILAFKQFHFARAARHLRWAWWYLASLEGDGLLLLRVYLNRFSRKVTSRR